MDILPSQLYNVVRFMALSLFKFCDPLFFIKLQGVYCTCTLERSVRRKPALHTGTCYSVHVRQTTRCTWRRVHRPLTRLTTMWRGDTVLWWTPGKLLTDNGHYILTSKKKREGVVMVMYNFANEGREGALPGSDAYVNCINQIPLNGVCVKKKGYFSNLKLKYLDFSPLNNSWQSKIG